MRRRRNHQMQAIFFAIIIILLLFIVVRLFTPESSQAKRVVDQFYTFEQKGEFGKSWELLHENMHLRFAKGAYIQDRAHTFMGHFGAETFTYEIDGGNKQKNFTMTSDAEPIDEVYSFVVTKTYHGKYGHFAFVQYVYVTEVDGKWRIMWEYKG